MTRHSGGAAINRGPSPAPARDEAGQVAGDVREQGEESSPDDRERGETPSAQVDDAARDRAS